MTRHGVLSRVQRQYAVLVVVRWIFVAEVLCLAAWAIWDWQPNPLRDALLGVSR